MKAYMERREEALKPLAKRPKVKGRGENKVTLRNYFLSPEAIESLKQAKNDGDKVPNPFNKGTKYFILEALKALGPDRNHSWTRFTEKFKELASAADTKNDEKKTFWQQFKNKPSRNAETGLDWEGRLEQTLEVMQRQGGNHPYAQPLIDLGLYVLGTKGVVIDILYGSTGEVMVRLNTESDTPTNETKRQPATPEQEAKKEAKKASKAAGKTAGTGKKRGRKPKVVTEAVVADPATSESVSAETQPVVEPVAENTVPAAPTEITQPVADTVVTESPATESPATETVADTAVDTVASDTAADTVTQ